MSYKSIGQVANYKPLTALGMEELAARQRLIQPSGGVLFAIGRRLKCVSRAVVEVPERRPVASRAAFSH